MSTFIPITPEEINSKIDILLITGDAYIDHPSFGIAILARYLEKYGFKVAILSQAKFPGQHKIDLEESIRDFRKLGIPKLFVGIGTGVVDSMINNYTADKKKRSDDVYSPKGQAGLRPDRAAYLYADLAKKAFPDTLIIGGGVESSLRRLAHYDYWENSIFPSILSSAPYDFLVYGMGEEALLNIAILLQNIRKQRSDKLFFKEATYQIRKMRSIVYKAQKEEVHKIENRLTIPSFEEVKNDKKKFARMSVLIEGEINPYNAKTIVQMTKDSAIVVTPPSLPLSEEKLDEIYSLPFTRKAHPSYKEKIPALETIETSITSNRGCFGGCSFCALTLHQGKIVQSRSSKSILSEIEKLTQMPSFKGYISDIGGPTANMYKMNCLDLNSQKTCRRPSCLFPTICPNLKTDHREQKELLKKARSLNKIKKIFIASGVRFDLALKDKGYIHDLVRFHVGGHLKVAPEHKDPSILELMRKPCFEKFEEFKNLFSKISLEINKEQYLVPYFISSFPGSTHESMQDLKEWLESQGLKLEQVQNFIPLPMTMASCMYWTELNPYTKEKLFVPKTSSKRFLQRKLLQSHRYNMKNTQALKKKKRKVFR